MPKAHTRESLLEKVEIKTSGCWEWKGAKRHFGHGDAQYHGKNYKAHRLFWELFKGEIPKGLCVLHSCDNPPCCNPDHLFLGTVLDNNRDKKNKNRQAKGESMGMAVLDDEKVRELRAAKREARAKGSRNFGGPDFAYRFGVSLTAICAAASGKTWKHVS